MKQNAWLWYLAFVVAIGQYYFVSSVSSTPSAAIYTVIGASSLVAVVAGMVVHRGSARIGWTLAAISIALYLAGDAVLAGLQDEHVLVPFPSTADWIYLAMYPVLIGAAVMIRRSVISTRSTADIIDGIIVGAAAFAVIGSIYMNDLFGYDLFGRQAQIVGSAYPVLDVALIAVAVWFGFGVARAAPGLAMISIGLVLVAVGNAVFNVQNAGFSFEAGGVADLCWLGFTTLLGAAALHPSVRRRPEREHADAISARSRRVIHAVALASIPAGHVLWGSGDDAVTTLGAGVLALGLVAWRTVGSRSLIPRSSASVGAVANA